MEDSYRSGTACQPVSGIEILKVVCGRLSASAYIQHICRTLRNVKTLCGNNIIFQTGFPSCTLFEEFLVVYHCINICSLIIVYLVSF